MLSTEACVSPDGSTVSYYTDDTKCSDLGLQTYHWMPEPFHHFWLWAHNTTLMFTLVLIGLLVLVYLVSKDKKSSDADKHHHDHLV